MKDLRISAVSYLNTLPFVNGIKNSGILKNYDLQLDIPSICARKFINKEVDVALVPVAALKNIKSYKLLNKYCIGSKGKVRTVILAFTGSASINKYSTSRLSFTYIGQSCKSTGKIALENISGMGKSG